MEINVMITINCIAIQDMCMVYVQQIKRNLLNVTFS